MKTLACIFALLLCVFGSCLLIQSWGESRELDRTMAGFRAAQAKRMLPRYEAGRYECWQGRELLVCTWPGTITKARIYTCVLDRDKVLYLSAGGDLSEAEACGKKP